LVLLGLLALVPNLYKKWSGRPAWSQAPWNVPRLGSGRWACRTVRC